MSSTFGKRSTAEEVVARFKDEIRGKNIVITGISPGSLGAEAVRTLAPYAGLIIAAGRSQERTAKTIEEVKKEVPSANIKTLQLDLTSLKSVRAAAEEVKSYNVPIHVLINNAAVAQPKEKVLTEDGFESQFGGNHLGHFLFTNLILPSIKEAATSSYSPRIVNVSSLAHTWADIRLDDPNYIKRPEEYSQYPAYGSSKTANILFTLELSKRLAKQNILSYSLHPGGILTNMALAVPLEDMVAFGVKRPDGSIVDPEQWKTIPEGTSTHIVAAFDPSIKAQSGAYLDDAQVANEKRAEWASSEENAAKLWTLSEELVGQSFPL